MFMAFAILLEIHDPGWNAARHRSVRDIADNTSPSTDERARADCRPWSSTCPHSETSETTDYHISRQRAPWTDMRPFTDRRIVIDRSASVDDCKVADRGRRVHHCAGHDGDAAPKLR